MTPPSLLRSASQWRRGLGLMTALGALTSGPLATADRPFFRPIQRTTVPAQSFQTPKPVAPVPTPAVPVAPSRVRPTQLRLPEPTSVLKVPPLPADSWSSGAPVIDSPQTVEAPCALVDVSDTFLNRLIFNPRNDAGPVNDMVLGAQVNGEQTTQSAVAVAFLPSPSTAKLDVLLDGETCSRTTAVTPQAAVNSRGKQRFDLRKSVEFDGAKFATRSPATLLESCQQNLLARTNATQIPVVGSIADTIALNEANRRQPFARQEAARKVTSRVVPPFNAGIDEQLGKANDALASLAAGMPLVHSFLTKAQWSSTEHIVHGALTGRIPVGSSAPPVRGGASLRLHESFAASLATATQLNGREISVEDVRRWIGMFDDDLRGAPPQSGFELPPLSAPTEASLRLADTDPLTATYANGEFRVILRAAIRAGGGVELPIHRITIGYAVRRIGEQIQLDPLPVSVIGEGTGSLVSGAIEQAIQSQIENRLQPVTVSPDAFPAMPNGTRIRISDVTLENGWLTVVLD